jgi:hypothetical protein
MKNIQLNEQQLDAIKKIVKWYFCNSSERNYFCCFGYA